jgi:hypothetical protein
MTLTRTPLKTLALATDGVCGRLFSAGNLTHAYPSLTQPAFNRKGISL